MFSIHIYTHAQSLQMPAEDPSAGITTIPGTYPTLLVYQVDRGCGGPQGACAARHAIVYGGLWASPEMIRFIMVMSSMSFHCP